MEEGRLIEIELLCEALGDGSRDLAAQGVRWSAAPRGYGHDAEGLPSSIGEHDGSWSTAVVVDSFDQAFFDKSLDEPNDCGVLRVHEGGELSRLWPKAVLLHKARYSSDHDPHPEASVAFGEE